MHFAQPKSIETAPIDLSLFYKFFKNFTNLTMWSLNSHGSYEHRSKVMALESQCTRRYCKPFDVFRYQNHLRPLLRRRVTMLELPCDDVFYVDAPVATTINSLCQYAVLYDLLEFEDHDFRNLRKFRARISR